MLYICYTRRLRQAPRTAVLVVSYPVVLVLRLTDRTRQSGFCVCLVQGSDRY